MANSFDAALSGLRTAQYGLATTSHNIANASTDGYTRQRIEQGTRDPKLSGNSWIGTGVDLQTTNRIRDEFIDGRLQALGSEHSRLQTFHSMASRIDTMLASDSLSLTPVMQEYFNSLENLNTDPSSQAARQVTINRAEDLVARLHSLDGQLGGLYEEVNYRVTQDISDINEMAESIATLNEEIIAAYAQSQGGAPNDLLDQRDGLIRDLSERVHVETIDQGLGELNVYVGNGINLVVGVDAKELVVATNPYDESQLEVGVRSNDGDVTNVNNLVTGGSLSGAMDFRREMLDGLSSELGRITTVMATEMNEQHAKGVDLYDEAGQEIFRINGPTVINQASNTGTATIEANISDVSQLTLSDYHLTFDGTDHFVTRLTDNARFDGIPATIDGIDFSISAGAMAAGDSFLIRPTQGSARTIEVAITDTNRLAMGAPVRGEAKLSNTGGAVLNQPSVSDATDPDLQTPITITFKVDPANPAKRLFDITDTATGAAISTDVAYNGGTDIALNGWVTQIEGIPSAGDTFSIGPSTNGVSDNRNGLVMANLQNETSIEGKSTFQEGYSTLVGRAGSLSRQTEIAGNAQEQLLDQTQQQRDSISAVNLDEEAINLTRYQQAYQASAQVIQISNTLFDSILAVFR